MNHFAVANMSAFCLATVLSFFIMSSKRKSGSSSTNFNFRPQTESKKWETKGTRPLPNPVTVQETLVTMIVQFCRKILFFNTKLRVGLYMAGLFLSFIFDVMPFPRSYFSRTDNLFNQYFVKIGWAWTLLLTLPFVLLTSFTYCCGSRKMIFMHLSRLGIATAVWFTFTKMFSLVEGNFGKCSKGRDFHKTKASCISDGYFWHSLDISGHTFILMWSTLVIIEEARVITGWESIKDMIRNEVHARSVNEVDLSSPVKKLTDGEFLIMRSSYNQFAPYVKALFISMTVLTVIWDVMMISTIVYFHIMIEKLVAGIFAACMWVLTYKYWYVKVKYPPQQPGYGLFKYTKDSDKQKENLSKNKFSQNSMRKPGQLPNVSGYGSKSQDKDKFNRDEVNMTNIDQELSKKIADKNRLSESFSQSSIGAGISSNQSLKNFGNKTI